MNYEQLEIYILNDYATFDTSRNNPLYRLAKKYADNKFQQGVDDMLIILMSLYSYPNYDLVIYLIEECGAKSINEALRHSRMLAISKYLVEVCGASKPNNIYLHCDYHDVDNQMYLLQHGFRYYPDTCKKSIKYMLKRHHGIILNTHPKYLTLRVAKPYVKRHLHIKSVLTKWLNVDVSSVIIEYVLYEK